MNKTMCSCGGEKERHALGTGRCYRELIPVEEEPKYAGHCPMNGWNQWVYDGGFVTEYTLKSQRMVAIHENGRWSRPKGGGSTISLPEEM